MLEAVWMDVLQFLSRKNIHDLRALKNVENLPCYHGFSNISKHAQMRQILPTNFNHRLDSKSMFCIILL